MAFNQDYPKHGAARFTISITISLVELMIEKKRIFATAVEGGIAVVGFLNSSRRIEIVFSFVPGTENYIPGRKVLTFPHMMIEKNKLPEGHCALCDIRLDFTEFGHNATLHQIANGKEHRIMIDNVTDINGVVHFHNKHNKPYKVIIDKTERINKLNKLSEQSIVAPGRKLISINNGGKVTEQEYKNFFMGIPFPVITPLYSQLVSCIRSNAQMFSIENKRDENSYFPDYIKQKLNSYYEFFNTQLRPIISSLPVKHGNDTIDIKTGQDIILISNEIEKVISMYYRADIFEATSIFNSLFDNFVKGRNGLSINLLQPGTSFYRARPMGEKPFSKENMFHVPFEFRHVVSVNRYSIPGMPALYVASDPDTCYMELDQPDIATLNFSRLENNSTLKVLEIRRVEEMLTQVLGYRILRNSKGVSQANNIKGSLALDNDLTNAMDDILTIIDYIILFPLTFASTVRVNFPFGKFKPEYIIPQLLLQKVRNDDVIDGISYPSSKIEYPKSGASEQMRNYVFPVKTNKKEGLCNELTKYFNITEPISMLTEQSNGIPIEKMDMTSLWHIVNSLEAKAASAIL